MALMTAALLLAADIFMMGDSTMCDYKPGSYPQEGWGQRLRTFAKEGVRVHKQGCRRHQFQDVHRLRPMAESA